MALAGTTNMTNFRQKIIWYGLPPNEDCVTEFNNRSLIVEVFEDIPTQKELSRAVGIIIAFDKERQGVFKKNIEFLTKCAADYGLQIIAVAQDDSAFASMDGIFKHTNRFPHKSLTAPKDYELAERMARWQPGPAINWDLEIEYGEEALSETHQLLLKRAFFDCKKISLKVLPGGRTAKVYQVEAIFKQSPFIPRPLPFYAKIGESWKIKKEYDNYDKYVQHFIPFHLRPNLEHKRSIFGNSDGIIVGNFVERSEPLRDTVLRGQSGIIQSIFLESLAGWRKQAKKRDGLSWDIFDPSQVPEERLRVAKEHGAQKAPEELAHILKSLPRCSYVDGIIHGDLHDLNVRVRGNDAILIDFAKIKDGPVVADCAVLEVSLVFEYELLDKDHKAWVDFVRRYYSLESCKNLPEAKFQKDSYRLAPVLHEIRKIACLKDQRASEYEYPIILSQYLLNRASYPGESEGDELHKVYAYLLGERIIMELAIEMGCLC